MITLTERQKKIVSFIEQWFLDYDYAPSVRDIQIGCDISSTSVVQYNLDKLKSLGILKSHSEVSRSLRLIQFEKKQLYPFEKNRNQTHELVAVPMLGTIAAGTPFPLPENETWSDMDNKEYIDLPQSIVGIGNDIYALKVKGKSMIDSLISDGDMVIMQHTKNVHNGQMAAVRFKKDNTTTLKHYFYQGQITRLEPANTQLKPIIIKSSEIEVVGKVKAIWRILS